MQSQNQKLNNNNNNLHSLATLQKKTIITYDKRFFQTNNNFTSHVSRMLKKGFSSNVDE